MRGSCYKYLKGSKRFNLWKFSWCHCCSTIVFIYFTTLSWMDISTLINLLIAMKYSFSTENIPHLSVQIVVSFALFCFVSASA